MWIECLSTIGTGVRLLSSVGPCMNTECFVIIETIVRSLFCVVEGFYLCAWVITEVLPTLGTFERSHTGVNLLLLD